MRALRSAKGLAGQSNLLGYSVRRRRSVARARAPRPARAAQVEGSGMALATAVSWKRSPFCAKVKSSGEQAGVFVSALIPFALSAKQQARWRMLVDLCCVQQAA